LSFGRTRAEAAHRASIFGRNLAQIREHNAAFERGEVSYKKGINQFTDQTQEEYLEAIHG
jgi:Cathepsin propeptide inhibitor domain (I29)